MRILLLGGSGQVGYELARCLPILGETVVVSRQQDGRSGLQCDLSLPASLPSLVDEVQPDVIVNAAAYTAVDRAESEASLATAVNAEAPRTLAKSAVQHGATLVHYSTDYVFAGDASRPYREDDDIAPTSVYGVSKASGEHAIRESECRHLILRTAWVYAARGQNFLRSMLRLAAREPNLRIVHDQRGSPTWARFLAASTAHLIARMQSESRGETTLSGIYHLTAHGSTTWYDYANYLFDQAIQLGLLAEMPKVEPVTSDAFPTPAKRPAWSVLDNSKVIRTFGIRVPHWREGVDACLRDMAEGR